MSTQDRKLFDLLDGFEMTKSEYDWLERRFENMTAKESMLFRGAMQIERPEKTFDVLQLINQLDHYELFYGAGDDIGLGHFVMNRIKHPASSARAYLDPAKVGAAFRQQVGSAFCDGHFIKISSLTVPLLDGDLTQYPDKGDYGYRLAGRDLEIIPEEAEVVRRIFSAYLSGQGKDDIARELNQLGVDRGRNREKWHPSTVAYILTNISYTGDMIWQKSCATDTIPFRQVRNLGQKPRYFVEHSHPAIVSCADFQRVQELMSSRKGQFHGTHRISKGSLYDKHIYCGGCGSLCRKKITVGKTYWVCRRHDGNKADCPSIIVLFMNLAFLIGFVAAKKRKDRNR